MRGDENIFSILLSRPEIVFSPLSYRPLQYGINYLPTTKKELEKWTKENCHNFNGYSINGNAIFEGYGIDNTEGIFTWYFTERGQIKKLQSFQSENEIIVYAFNQIKTDKWARSLCIGFTTSKDEKNELENILQERSIEYFQDKIPYYGIERPVYRTFIYGCDINKTQQLKEKYYVAL